jgi:hypothetical protein
MSLIDIQDKTEFEYELARLRKADAMEERFAVLFKPLHKTNQHILQKPIIVNGKLYECPRLAYEATEIPVYSLQKACREKQAKSVYHKRGPDGHTARVIEFTARYAQENQE